MGTKKVSNKLNKLKNLFKLSKGQLNKTDEIINEQIKEIDVSLLNTTIELSALIDNLSRFKTPNEWASITYYEKNKLIGTFTSNENIIIVDGSTGTSLRTRFCIGNYGDKLNKQQEFKKARSLIRAGVKFEFNGDDVFVTNNSATDLYIHPLGLNKYYNRTDNTVYRVTCQKKFLIFKKSIFQRQLLDHLQESDEAAGELYNSCNIRMSFTTGWGHHRSLNDITAIPCWLELKLHIPIGILESVLGPSIKPPALGHQKYASINPSHCHKHYNNFR